MHSTKPRAREDLAVVEVDGEVVIYDEVNENLHHLNPTATVVFSMCDGEITGAEIADEIADTFELAAAEVRPQIFDLLEQLHEAGLLEEGVISS